jgi:hypothetical protein
MGFRSVGTDVDPLAVFVSRVKTLPLNPEDLARSWRVVQPLLAKFDRGADVYSELQHQDIPDDEFAFAAGGAPAIPNLNHWFRHYVVVDLDHIRRSVLSARIPGPHRDFFMLCFASIIRSASNADPVPVSGLEVTSHMLRLEKAGRIVDPFSLFERAVVRGMRDMAEYSAAVVRPSQVSVRRADATRLGPAVRSGVQAVVTSPPYHGAVDYYRRHQLEMFWLGMTTSQADRLRLLDGYIGRPKVPQSNRLVASGRLSTPGAMALEASMRQVSAQRADAFKHYCLSMTRVFKGLGHLLPSGAPALFVVGHSGWNGGELRTSELFAELAMPQFRLEEVLWYPVTNRYMSYERHNGANIDREYVVALRRST